MDKDEKKEVILRLAKAINSGDFDALDDILAVDYIRHDPNPLMKEAGCKEYKEAFRNLRGAFPDGQWKHEELLYDGDRVIGRWSFKGTHTGHFF